MTKRTLFTRGDTVVHKHDPAWVGTVIAVSFGAISVRRVTPNGAIEATFTPEELTWLPPGTEESEKRT